MSKKGPAPDKNRAVLRGPLNKYVSHGGGKHERYCCLFEDAMCWYKSKNDKFPTKFVKLKDLRFSPRPKLNEYGVADPTKFILIDIKGEQILFEAPTATAKDKWVNAITFRFEVVKGISPQQHTPTIHSAARQEKAASLRAAGNNSSARRGTAPSSNTSSGGSGGGSRRNTASTTPASTPAVSRVPSTSSDLSFPSVPSRHDSGTSSSIDFPSVPSHPDDVDDDDDDGGIAFPSTPTSKPTRGRDVPKSTLDVDAFPSTPNKSSSTRSNAAAAAAPVTAANIAAAHETVDSELFPTVPGRSAASKATMDSDLFPTVPSGSNSNRGAAAATNRSVAAATTTATSPRASAMSGDATSDDDDAFACPWCDEAFTQLLMLQRHTKEAHKRDLTYECVFPHCTKSYTEQANLLSHMRKQHPGYLAELGLEENEPDTAASHNSSNNSTSNAAAVEQQSAPPVPAPIEKPSLAVDSPKRTRRIDPKLAARRAKALAELAPPDPKKSLYRDFLLDPDELDNGAVPLVDPLATGHESDSGSIGENPPPYTPLAYGQGDGETSLAAVAAAAAANAKRLTPRDVRATTTSSSAASSSAAAPPLVDSDSDDVPDVPSFPTHVPSFDSNPSISAPPAATPNQPTATATTSTAATATTAALNNNNSDSDSSSDDDGGGGGGGLFSKNALLAARSKMKAPPTTKGVSLDAPRPARGRGGGAMKGDQKTPAMLESLLKLLFEDEEQLDDNTRAAAVANWMRLFNGKWPILQRLVDDYGGLVRKHALQPNTAYKKMNLWEKELFKKLPVKEAVAMRREKKFLMEKLDMPEIKQHIQKQWEVIAAKKAKEEETRRLMEIEKRRAAKAAAKSGGAAPVGGGGMAGLFAELKAKAGTNNAAPAIAEPLPEMEEEIDFEDD